MKEGDQVNRVQTERTFITAAKIREATRGDAVLSRVLHFVQHGWPAEENTPEELRFYRTKREKSTFVKVEEIQSHRPTRF